TMSTDAEFVSFSSSPSGSSLRFKRVEPRADRPLSSSFIFSIGDESKVNEKDFFLLLKTDAVARGASYSWLDGYVEKVAKSVKAKVVSIPAGADIQIDGVPAGKAPLETAPLPAGSEMLVTAVHSGITASLKTIVPLDSKPVEIRVEKEIEIRSEPAGATLLLDGKVLGPSPQRIKLEAGSEHSIRADFGEWDALAKFKVDSALDSLRLVPMTGALSITAQPHLALISVPGIQLAMSADASYAAEDVPPGRYYLEASLPDYETQRVDFEVKPGEKASLAISLQKAQRSLTIQSSPPGAIITVDGVEIGAAPAETIPHEVGSAHTIFADFNKEMSGKRQVTVSLDSTPIVIEPDTGSLRIDVTPPDARVSIDGIELERVGEGKYKASNIKPGTYNLRAIQDRFAPIEQSIVVSRGKSLFETIALHPQLVEMVSVSGGTFMMGSNEGYSDEKPVHQVTVSSFMIGRYEVTQEQYQKVMGTNPSKFTSGSEAPRRPVEQVSWYDAVAFCNKLSELEGLQKVYTITGTNVQADFSRNGYRLPTEAEWEYAARGGSQSKGYTYSGSNSIDSVAWYSNNSGSSTHAVGTKAPNELGLYDMSGNVWEWCWDWYKNSYDSWAQKDPMGASSGGGRVLRGGCWGDSPSNLRSAYRGGLSPGNRYNILGFRLVRRP
ncbi:MAG TPA: SUMF1/EgtB/PvdO family nonheme iron enzyme, partial [Rectinemataceae bacterium]